MHFFKIPFVFFFTFLWSTCFDFSKSTKVGNCDPDHGLLVYYDVSQCNSDVQWNYKSIASQYIDGEIYAYGQVSPETNRTICLPDGFNGNLYLTNDKIGFLITSINLQTIKSNQTLQAFYQTRSDDQAFIPGKKPILFINDQTLLSNLRFADTPENTPKIDFTSTSSQVLQSSQIHNALWITYCNIHP